MMINRIIFRNLRRILFPFCCIALTVVGCTPDNVEETIIETDVSQTSINSPLPTFTPSLTNSGTVTPTSDQPRILKNGITGEDVKSLENKLLALGYTEIGIEDGYYGIQDEAAVKHFQLLSNLPITGIMEEVTWGALNDVNPAAYTLPPAFPGKVSALSSTAPVCDDHALQDRLAVMGYMQPGSEEWSIGAFGPETRDALLEFEKYYMPKADGIPDLESWNKVFSPIPHWTFGGVTVEVESWPTTIYPADQNVVALAWDGSRLWLAVSKGSSVYENYLIRIDPNEHPAEAITLIRPRNCETQNAQIANMFFAGEKIWLLYTSDGDGNPVPMLQFIEPDTGIAHIPFEFANCPDGYCVPTNGMGVTKGQLWVAANDRAYGIDASTGRVISSQPVGFLAVGKMVFDGQCFWYQGEAMVTSFNPLGGACRSSNIDNSLFYGTPETDGELVWTLNFDGSLSQLNVDTGVSITLDPFVSSASALIFGKDLLWIADNSNNTVIGFSPESGNYGDPIQLNGENPAVMVQESNNLWVYYGGSGTVEQISIENYKVTPVTRTSTPAFTATPSPTLPVIYRTLYLTTPVMQGDDVLLLQNALLSWGFVEVGEPDGYFGRKTDEAVRNFQAAHGLTQDGIVGPQTWNKLFDK